MPSYMHRRQATYYTRLIVPPRLRPIIGQTDLGRSLRTRDLAEAKRLYPHWLAEAQAKIAAAEAELAKRTVASAPYDPYADMTLEQVEDLEQFQREQLWEIIAEDDLAERLAAPDPKLSSDDLVPMAHLLKQAEAGRARYRERYKKRKERDRQRKASTKAEEPTFWISPSVKSTVTMLVPDDKSVGGLQINTIVDLWAAERKPREKTIDAHNAVARWFYDRIGRKPVDQITKPDVLAFKTALVGEGQSHANIKTKLSRLRTLLQWAADNGYVETNVAAGVSIKVNGAAKVKRRPFDLPALNAIFGSPIYIKGDRPVQGRGEAAYWLPLLALFTGARLEELGQLRPDDVVRRTFPNPEGDEEAAWFLHLVETEGDEDDDDGDTATKLKNAASERLVPVHPELERLGFVAFAQAMGKQGRARIFHELRPDKYGTLTAKWGEWWSKYRRGVCGVTDRRMVFHSFRHTFKDHARNAGVLEGVQRQMMGHSGEDVADDYGSGHSLYRLVEGMKLYRVQGLKLPT